LGRSDLVICSNVYEHLSKPVQFLKSAQRLLTDKGFFYLSWTNWLSPWGGHEFSPFHYLGSTRGHLIYEKLTGRSRLHTPFVNLFPTYIGQTLRILKAQTEFRLVAIAPRYYPEFSFITRIPGLRELFTWNCAILMQPNRSVM
jgi:SAM-dependent methyltransferase